MIAISIGDVTGIGPEVTLKALAAELRTAPISCLLIGDDGYLQRLNQQLRLGLRWRSFASTEGVGELFWLNPLTHPLPADLPAGSPEAASAAVAWVKEGARLCLEHQATALVTAPVNKESIIRSGIPFVGQTELLSGLAETERTAMMLLGADDRGRWLRVVLATTHLPLREVPQKLTRAKIELAIELGAQACRDLGLPRARVGVCGLNPHAGEGGQLGTEEPTIIEPAIRAAWDKQIDVSGPHPADSLFYYALRGDFEVVVAMYHDQGLVPLKMIGFDSGVNWTLGLPFIRTSPDHGTAYDIVGRGIANPSSMQAALRLARQLSIHR